MSKEERYAEKIGLLLRKAESTTPEEAELLIAKAQELMTKYAIDQAMVDAKAGVERDEIVQETFTYKGTYRHATCGIGWAVLKANGCRGVFYDRGDERLYSLQVAGFKTDVDRSRMLDASLQIQCASALGEWWKQNPIAQLLDRNQKFAARREFVFGFIRGLGDKLRAASAAAEAEYVREQAKRESATEESVALGMGLVLRSRKDRVDEWMDETYGNSLRSVSTSYKHGGRDAREAGYGAGQRADTGQPSVGGRRGLNR